MGWCRNGEEGARLVPGVKSPFLSTAMVCLAAEEHSGLWSLFSLLILFVPPNPVELGGSCAAHKEVDSKQVPVLWDYDQRVSGPDQPCGRQHCRLGGAELVRRSSHVSQTGTNQTPFEHRGPKENGFWTCRVVVQRSEFGGEDVLDPVQDPVIGRSECSHDSSFGDEENTDDESRRLARAHVSWRRACLKSHTLLKSVAKVLNA